MNQIDNPFRITKKSIVQFLCTAVFLVGTIMFFTWVANAQTAKNGENFTLAEDKASLKALDTKQREVQGSVVAAEIEASYMRLRLKRLEQAIDDMDKHMQKATRQYGALGRWAVEVWAHDRQHPVKELRQLQTQIEKKEAKNAQDMATNDVLSAAMEVVSDRIKANKYSNTQDAAIRK